MTDTNRESELRTLIRYAVGLGLSLVTVQVVYEGVSNDPAIAQSDRLEEARTRLFKAALSS